MRGDGSLILREGIYYARFYVRGREVRESLRTKDEATAERRFVALRKRRDRGTYLEPGRRRVTVDELLDDLQLHLDVRKAASAEKVKSALKAVRLELGHRQANELETAAIERAQAAWLREGTAPATVNRRCEALRQAYRLAARRSPPKVLVAPLVPLLKVQNARQGFLSREDVTRLLAGLPDEDVRDFVEWSSWTGMRPGESRQLTWAMVDLQAWRRPARSRLHRRERRLLEVEAELPPGLRALRRRDAGVRHLLTDAPVVEPPGPVEGR